MRNNIISIAYFGSVRILRSKRSGAVFGHTNTGFLEAKRSCGFPANEKMPGAGRIRRIETTAAFRLNFIQKKALFA
ncbi:MAG: hypothetical protein A3B30_01690 [Candidatus Komeilibacteria bacterium RIFCSPLOWO2_01_FULL_52_15]|uniref:Uncharacterized protein n=1 Tax=Candidatus Komeilibacteria bacterium RIFCSPLOWO2_01_FULL_52_15 TaxID=1798551 RepID=A0A1G2BPE4_9BACT|nr:MAG: hypothetical protein A3B30_01690 [Candidatus Komeilibacteria bacterium RIFCSPLOWO2_01_FULL_52_15]